MYKGLSMKEVEKISVSELNELSKKFFEPIVKAVVDVQNARHITCLELHADGELYLLENGSVQKDIWGVNLWLEFYGTNKFITFDSFINIRPSQANPSKYILDNSVKQRIRAIVEEKIDE
jgi:hypothetical protein